MHDAGTTDALLVERYLAGDAGAFACLVKMHIDHVYAFALRTTGDPQMAEDVTQQTFVNAWKHLKKYDSKRKFATWLFAIAHNVAIDNLRKVRSIPFSRFDREDGSNSIIDTMEDPLPLPDALFANAEIGVLLARALATLSPHERAIIALHHEEDFTFEEMAGMLEKSRDTLKSQYRRALLKLRGMLLENIK